MKTKSTKGMRGTMELGEKKDAAGRKEEGLKGNSDNKPGWPGKCIAQGGTAWKKHQLLQSEGLDPKQT